MHKRNPIARALRTLRPKVIQSKKSYRRRDEKKSVKGQEFCYRLKQSVTQIDD